MAPLIQCDYCPLLFHMDCLDPPLTTLPAGKWMCPNHVEHLVVREKCCKMDGYHVCMVCVWTSHCQFASLPLSFAMHVIQLFFFNFFAIVMLLVWPFHKSYKSRSYKR